MKTFEVTVTRDCRMTQSGVVIVEAVSAEDAEQKAIDIPQEKIEWVDDDFWAAGEDGIYVADPDSIFRVPFKREVRL